MLKGSHLVTDVFFFAIYFNNHGILHSVREVVKRSPKIVVNFDVWSLILALVLRVSLAWQQSL